LLRLPELFCRGLGLVAETVSSVERWILPIRVGVDMLSVDNTGSNNGNGKSVEVDDRED